ncbi:MAG: DUF305 domain-containing protein [Bacteroidota bacterium]
MKISSIIIAAAVLALSVSACQNNTSKTDHSSMDTADASHMDMSSSGEGMMSGMDKMMKEMHQMEMTGNATHDFAQMMHHHHMGAVEMANTELASGTDAELKKTAQSIVDMQSTEMGSWRLSYQNIRMEQKIMIPQIRPRVQEKRWMIT